jgi:hypothetical protein
MLRHAAGYTLANAGKDTRSIQALPRPQRHPASRPLHRAVAEPVQELLPGFVGNRWRKLDEFMPTVHQHPRRYHPAECIRGWDSTVLMSDGRCPGKPNFQGIALSISAKTEAEADKLFNGLADG